jgi:predicted tellurium resistance membrane protein TerC
VDDLLTLNNLLALLTLTVLEIVLGIDNIVFVAILTGRLPKDKQPRARSLGLGMALLTRILLLLAINWVIHLTRPLFTILTRDFSGRDLVLIGGGLFLLAKSTYEIRDTLAEARKGSDVRKPVQSVAAAVVQIGLLDIIFSLDSVITAVGMAEEVIVMIAAIVIAMGIMLIFSGPVSKFIEKNPPIKMLALSFLILIGVTLMAEGLGTHVSKGYIYFAMGFSLGVEVLNLRWNKKRQQAETERASKLADQPRDELEQKDE